MAYTKAQFISYQLNTFTSYKNSHGRYEYLGNEKAETDICYRMNVMKNAIKKAQASMYIDNDIDEKGNKTLKIFMAPEFYFRGSKGAYPIEKVSLVMEKMRELTKDDSYKDWLFVFGTALGYIEENDNFEIFNVALVQKGGRDIADDGAKLVYKEYISHIDFARDFDRGLFCSNCGHFNEFDWSVNQSRRGVVGPSTGDHTAPTNPLLTPVQGSSDVGSSRVHATGAGKEQSKSGLGGQGIFTIDGVTFALEICLDHLNGRLRKSPPLQGQNIPQIHLITSAGADIVQNHVLTDKGGLVFNVDGNEKTRINRNIGDIKAPAMQYSSMPAPIRIPDIIHLDLSSLATGWNQYFATEGDILVFESLGFPQPKVQL